MINISVSPALAATPADVVGKKQQSAIEELMALGIINGYEDGTFKPDNNITRAELAKIVVSATGGAKDAELMKSVKPQFKDVKTNQWYTGYINVAATKGFMLGDQGTNTFRPNGNIKFEEVVAIMIRALGNNGEGLGGAWPYNVLLPAEENGLFKKVDIKPETLATNGIVAQMVHSKLGEKELKLLAHHRDKLNFKTEVEPSPMPDGLKPEVPNVDEPKPEVPNVNEPKPEVPNVNEPKPEVPNVD